MRLMHDDATSYLEQIGTLTYRRRRIFHFDHVPFPLLVSLIRGAKSVLFPSLYEGFGLPIVEAMKLGTPVLSSREGPIPEIAGDGALLIDPYDTRAIAEGIRELDTNAELRASLGARGRRRANLFSPSAHQRRLAALYDRVLAPRRAPRRRPRLAPARPIPEPATARAAAAVLPVGVADETRDELGADEITAKA
jgi:glycosyltransferase involved in cell wall biosynthesis